jgi:NitT/TauT family transport system substrate-binding protein
MSMRNCKWLVGALALCSLALGACRKAQTVEDDSRFVKIGYLSSIDALPYVVAQQQGIFDSLRLAVKLMPMADVTDRDTLFMQKVTDGVILSSVEALRMQQQGVSVVPVAPCEGRLMLVASADSNFVSLRQLVNRCLAVADKNVSAYYAEQLITRLNYTTDQLGMPSLADEALRTQMLIEEQVDAAVLSEPYVSKAVSEGCKVLADSRTSRSLYSLLAFSDSIVQTRRPELQQLLMGYNLAVRYMSNRPQREWLPQAIATLGLPCVPDSLPAFRPLRPMEAAQLNALTDWMKGKKLLPEEAAPARVDNSLMQEAMKLN